MVWSTTDDAYLADISSRCGEHPFADYAKVACTPDFPQSPLHLAVEETRQNSCAETSPVRITLLCKASSARNHLEHWRHKVFGRRTQKYFATYVVGTNDFLHVCPQRNFSPVLKP